MPHVFALLLALLAPAQASEAFDSLLEQERYRAEIVQVEHLPNGSYRLFDGNRKPVSPGDFAQRVGDHDLAERYRRSTRLNRTAAILMWSYGGAGIVGGFYMTYVSLVGFAITGETPFAIGGVAGLAFMASGAICVPLGFVAFFNGRKRLNDPRSWWRPTELDRLVDEHNDKVDGWYGAEGRRIEVRGVVSPNALALNVRF